MENTREAIAKIEASLDTEIEAAALKRDLNKMVLALTESVRNLVIVAKEMADALDNIGAPPVIKKAPAKKKAVAAKKAPVKRIQKQPIAPK